MKNKNSIFIIFCIIALIQLFVPFKMIWNKEDTLKNGVVYKFKTMPVDPTDQFIGKYLILSFKENSIKTKDRKKWESEYGQPIYVSIKKDSAGFAKIKSISEDKPSSKDDFFKAKIGYIDYLDKNTYKININFPFDKYYMDENKAYNAEVVYNKSLTNSTKTTYALVSIKDGDSVLKDVLIDGASIKNIK